jgi:hypothetical protein
MIFMARASVRASSFIKKVPPPERQLACKDRFFVILSV